MKRHDKKYNKRIALRIAELLETDTYRIVDICKAVGISEATYFNWKLTRPEFLELTQKAIEKRTEGLLIECEKSLKKLFSGYETEEVHTIIANGVDGKPIIKEQKKVKKHIAPNLGAIIHFQTNKDPQNWQNRQSVRTEAKVEIINDKVSQLTDEQLEGIASILGDE